MRCSFTHTDFLQNKWVLSGFDILFILSSLLQGSLAVIYYQRRRRAATAMLVNGFT